MSNGPTIQGVGTHGTDQPYKVFRKFKAATNLSKGTLVQMSNLDGVNISAAAASTFVVGVMAEDALSGEYCKVQVKGYCDYIVTDGGASSTQALVPTSSGVCDSVAGASATVFRFGVALADDVGTVLSSAWIDCFGA